MSNERTEFDYLLNAFEQASQADAPAENGYAAKRAALFQYVRRIERKAVEAQELKDRIAGALV